MLSRQRGFPPPAARPFFGPSHDVVRALLLFSISRPLKGSLLLSYCPYVRLRYPPSGVPRTFAVALAGPLSFGRAEP